MGSATFLTRSAEFYLSLIEHHLSEKEGIQHDGIIHK